MTMPERSFGRTIKSRRTTLGLSQAKLGELVGRSPTTIRSWERGTTMPGDPSVITALAAVLGVNERTLFERAGIDRPEVETSPTVEEALASLTTTDPSPRLEPKSAAIPAPVAHQTTTSREVLMTSPATTQPIVRASYIEDPEQKSLYQVRTVATLIVLAVLAITFVWSLSAGLESLGAWWDDFFGNLRL